MLRNAVSTKCTTNRINSITSDSALLMLKNQYASLRATMTISTGIGKGARLEEIDPVTEIKKITIKANQINLHPANCNSNRITTRNSAITIGLEFTVNMKTTNMIVPIN